VEVDLSDGCQVKSHDLAAQLVPQLSPGAGFDVLLVADAPVDVLGLDHRSPLLVRLVPGG